MRKQNIFLLLFDIYTLFVWFLLVLEFLTKGNYRLSTILVTLYLILLTFYASDKEIRRWRRKLERKRKGEIFVYLWILTLVGIVAFYIFGGQKKGYTTPGKLPTITGAVLIIYPVRNNTPSLLSRVVGCNNSGGV